MTAVDIIANALSAAAQSGDPIPVIVGAFVICFAIPAVWLVVRCMTCPRPYL